MMKGAPGFRRARMACRVGSLSAVRDEMHGQDAGRGIEGALRRVGCVALDQGGLVGVRAHGLGGEGQHLCTRIDACETPVGVILCEMAEFEAAACAEDEKLGGVGQVFGQQKVGHREQAVKARHLAAWAVGVAGDGLGVGEGHLPCSRSNSGSAPGTGS